MDNQTILTNQTNWDKIIQDTKDYYKRGLPRVSLSEPKVELNQDGSDYLKLCRKMGNDFSRDYDNTIQTTIKNIMNNFYDYIPIVVKIIEPDSKFNKYIVFITNSPESTPIGYYVITTRVEPRINSEDIKYNYTIYTKTEGMYTDEQYMDYYQGIH